MQKHFKKYFSVFFLALLLFPMVEKQVHAYEHRDDIHCSATDKHFHTLEHSCSICDYTSTDSNPSAENRITFYITAVNFQHTCFSAGINIPTAFQDLPSRAPPLV